MSDFEKLKDELKLKLSEAKNSQEVDIIRTNIFGKNGLINLEFKKLGSLSPDDKKKVASEINNAKQELTKLFNDKVSKLANSEIDEQVKNEKDDVTLPEKDFRIGKIHPVSQVIDEISSIFSEIGFSVEEGPDVESEYYNFTALNTPENHPAKDMHDTFYIEENMKTLLRTHTSPVQVRTMLKGKPPFKIIAPGRTYRSDSDSTHTPMFHQVEGLLIDEKSTMAHLKGCLIDFLKEFFEISDLKYRFRPSYFPFTEPSAEMDIAYTKTNNILKFGEGDEWMEILGCGMVNPIVLENCKIDSKKFQGFAFGMGIERLSMLKYGITDIRSFYESDFRWIQHYGFNPLDLNSTSGL